MEKLNGDSGLLALREGRIAQLNRALSLALEREKIAHNRLGAVQFQRDQQFKSRWFRIGLRLGFYY